jgi:hypothetical protein
MIFGSPNRSIDVVPAILTVNRQMPTVNPQQVMELCGGKFGELSKLEIQKRDDLSEAEK